MKRTLVVLATLSMAILFGAFLAATTPAQTPPPPLVSPEVHADKSVTFRFRAPNDKEVVVSLEGDRKSTRLNSSHRCISYAVFCLKKKKKKNKKLSEIQQNKIR